MGLAFGLIYLFLPVISGALTGTAIQIFPIPFSDFTPKTGQYLPAFATGINWSLGNVIGGMVMPYWGMVGSFIGLIITLVANPLLYHYGILSDWKQGDDTIVTLFKNNIDFYFSLHIGIALAIALAGIYQVFRSMQNPAANKDKCPGVKKGSWLTFPKGVVTSRMAIIFAIRCHNLLYCPLHRLADVAPRLEVHEGHP